MRIDADNSNLEYCGRIDWTDLKAPVWVFPCTSVRIRFTGSRSLRVFVKNRNSYWDNFLGCTENGVQRKLALPKEGEAVIEIPLEKTQDGEHEVLLFKRQDSCHEVTFMGFELEDGAEILPVKVRTERKIEVYGDSVSAGEISEAVEYAGKPDPEHNGEYSNSWYSYAWMTARRLNAQIHDIAQGGIALMDHTGWFYDPEAVGMESAWDKIHYSPAFGSSMDWDFTKYIPQVVIVAIGQNDSHPEDYMKEDPHGARARKWKEHYKMFLKKLREKYPEAQIVCITTLLEHDGSWDAAIGEAVESLKDPRISRYLFRRNGRGTPGHLRIPEAEEMAEELSAYIETLEVPGWTR